MYLKPHWLKGSAPGESLPDKLKLSTWNVWFDRHQREWRHRALLSELKIHRPHVMLFQEVTLPFVRTLLDTAWLEFGYWISGIEHDQIGVVMVSRLRPESVRFEPLTSQMGRRLLVAEFGQGLTVAAAHFESNRSSGPTRALQFRESLQILNNSEAWVLAGDFNSQAQDPESKALASAIDCWTTLHPQQPGFTVDTEQNATAARDKRSLVQIRIDRVLCGGRSSPQSVELLGTQPFSGQDHPSDHFGLLAELALFHQI